jgi:hypothetical protein
MESLLGVSHLTRKGDYMFSFDLKDGFLLALASRCLVLMYNVAICHPST